VYLGNVNPVIRPMQAYYAQNPRLRSAPTTWSGVEPQVRRRYPHAFKEPRRQARAHRRPQRRPPKKKRPRKN